MLVMHKRGIGKNAATGQRAIITAPNSDLQLCMVPIRIQLSQRRGIGVDTREVRERDKR